MSALLTSLSKEKLAGLTLEFTHTEANRISDFVFHGGSLCTLSHTKQGN